MQGDLSQLTLVFVFLPIYILRYGDMLSLNLVFYAFFYPYITQQYIKMDPFLPTCLVNIFFFFSLNFSTCSQQAKQSHDYILFLFFYFVSPSIIAYKGDVYKVQSN